jgi:hypothetical protein
MGAASNILISVFEIAKLRSKLEPRINSECITDHMKIHPNTPIEVDVPPTCSDATFRPAVRQT